MCLTKELASENDTPTFAVDRLQNDLSGGVPRRQVLRSDKLVHPFLFGKFFEILSLFGRGGHGVRSRGIQLFHAVNDPVLFHACLQKRVKRADAIGNDIVLGLFLTLFVLDDKIARPENGFGRLYSCDAFEFRGAFFRRALIVGQIDYDGNGKYFAALIFLFVATDLYSRAVDFQKRNVLGMVASGITRKISMTPARSC